MGHFTTFVTASEITGKKSELAELQKLIGSFHPESALEVISWLGLKSQVWRPKGDFDHHLALAEKFLKPVLAKRLRSISKSGERPLFSRIGLLILAREVLSRCQSNGVSADAEGGIGRVMLATLLPKISLLTINLGDSRKLISSVRYSHIARPHPLQTW